ncbi:MAG: hypothetical protein Phog2KO_38380 [Phototrophicaceae bacterium]
MEGIIYNTVGTIGVAVILITYFLLQTERLKANQLEYSVMNFIGSSMILASLFYEFNFPSFVVEVAWVVISLMGIIRHFIQRRGNEQV